MRISQEFASARASIKARKVKAALQALDQIEKKAEKLESGWAQESADNLDHEYDLMQATQLLEKVAKTNPKDPLPRDLRDQVHVLLGRLKEARMHKPCGCEACGGRTRIQVYLDATKNAE